MFCMVAQKKSSPFFVGYRNRLRNMRVGYCRHHCVATAAMWTGVTSAWAAQALCGMLQPLTLAPDSEDKD